ncbi:hypothetical protein BsWGS_00150 [Bradybaena similaris]
MANLLLLVLYSVVALTAYPTVAAIDVPTLSPSYTELLVKVGTTQDLNCTVTTSTSNNLHWSYPGIEKPVNNVRIWRSIVDSVSGDTATMQLILQILNFEAVNSGLYKCILQKNDNTSVIRNISLVSVTENKTEPRFVKDEKSANLSCDISLESNRPITDITWLKVINKSNEHTEQLVSKLKNTANYKEENISLTITNPTIDDTGLYIARFRLAGNAPNTYDCQVGFEVGPQVQDFEKPKNYIEGEKMDLKCTVKGYPLSTVTWYKDNAVLNISKDGRHMLQETFDEHHFVSLVVQKVVFEDAGDYTCEAYSALFNETSRKTLTVRVKDKLAALWPFLGIVGEVVVLCTIIFIYEKRRNKQVQQEEKAAEEVDGSATDKKEGLRHRNTNPSA